MSRKEEKGIGGIVFSTDPQFKFDSIEPDVFTLPATQQRLKVSLDKKQRSGKSVTLVSGFQGKIKDLEDLGRKLKTHCGTGGSVKGNEILVQGDNRAKVSDWLKKNHYQ